MPELKIQNAFGLNANNYEIADGIEKIITLIGITKNFESLIKTINLNLLQEIWYFVKKYDANAETIFKESVLRYFPNSDLKLLIREYKARWTIDNFNNLKNKTIEFYAKVLQRRLSVTVKKSITEIIYSYNNSIDIYLMSIAFYLDDKNSLRNFPGKNDYLDLNHLTYLNNQTDQIVTNDKMLLRILNKINPNIILNSNKI